MKNQLIGVVLATASFGVSSQHVTIKGSIQKNQAATTAPTCKSIIAIGATLENTNDTTTKVSISFDASNNTTSTFQTDEEFICELSDGSDVPLRGTPGQIQELRALLNNGVLISGQSSVDVEEEASFSQEVDDMSSPARKPFQMMRARPHSPFEGDAIAQGETAIPITSLQLPPGPIHLKPSQHNRKLRTVYHGPKPVLAVKVIDKNNLQHQDSPSIISNKIFGTYGDTSTMTSQFAACSYNKLQIQPADTVMKSRERRILSDVGVLEVVIPVSLKTSSQGTVRKEVKKAIEQKLGYSLPGKFHHVMVILQDCYVECGWSAYAFVNSWLSVYKGDNYKYTAVQLHEIGHNLNMAHSGGLDGKIYTDHSCVMGNPLFSDDVGRMCYNAAKNYQFANAGAWYSDKSDTISWDSGQKSGTFWHGKLIGIAEYGNNSKDYPIAIRIVTGTDRDYYLGFNRRTGINWDVKISIDEVTLIEAGNGNSYAQSFIKSSMSEGDVYEFKNWRKSNEKLRVTINRIDTSVVPGYADVSITFGHQTSQTNPPTRLPSFVPTTSTPSTSPSVSPSSSPSTSPSVNPSTSPSMGPSSSPSRSPTGTPTISPSSSPIKSNISSQSPTSTTSTNDTADGEINRAPPVTASPISASPITAYPNANQPSAPPSTQPSHSPTRYPTMSPTTSQTKFPFPSAPQVVEYDLETRSGKGSSKGLKFTIRARRDIYITGFDITPRKNRPCQMQVYTHPGDYRNDRTSALNEDGIEIGWKNVYDSTMKLKAHRLAAIQVDDDEEVFIPQWGVQSFVIYCNKGMLVAPGRHRDEGVTFSENDDIEVREGITSKKAFSKYTGTAQLRGKVRYYVK